MKRTATHFIPLILAAVLLNQMTPAHAASDAMPADPNHVLTASGSRLLVQAPTSCIGSNSLLWFNPGTHAEQWLIRAPSNVIGVENAIPFSSRQNGNL